MLTNNGSGNEKANDVGTSKEGETNQQQEVRQLSWHPKRKL
jgi:hypothetical protein